MTRTTVKSFFAIHEVVVLTGFSKYMLDYLAREDIFAPAAGAVSGRGRPRRYSYEDVVLLRALHAVCAGKGKIRHLKPALAAFRKGFGRMTPGQRLDLVLCVQGDELCVRGEGESLMRLRDSQLSFAFWVDMSMVTKDVAACIEVDPATGHFKLTSEAASKAAEQKQLAWNPIRDRRAAR
jgi:hypothetical protein